MSYPVPCRVLKCTNSAETVYTHGRGTYRVVELPMCNEHHRRLVTDPLILQSDIGGPPWIVMGPDAAATDDDFVTGSFTVSENTRSDDQTHRLIRLSFSLRPFGTDQATQDTTFMITADNCRYLADALTQIASSEGV